MIEIIPAINAETFAEVERKIRLVEPHITRVHIDVADGSFTPNILSHQAGDLNGFVTPCRIEVHLMLADIEQKIVPWLVPNIERIIFHAEVARDAGALIDQCHEAHIEAGVAVCPETPADVLLPYQDKVDILQVLAVSPGKAGQPFDPLMLEKTSKIRHNCPTCAIEFDGGVRIENAHDIAKAGATILVAASAIFDAPDIAKAIESLRRNVQPR